jgi:hypothetical protein
MKVIIAYEMGTFQEHVLDFREKMWRSIKIKSKIVVLKVAGNPRVLG